MAKLFINVGNPINEITADYAIQPLQVRQRRRRHLDGDSELLTRRVSKGGLKRSVERINKKHKQCR